MKTLLIDNYDSFSRILFQYLWEVNGEEPLFIANDAWTLADLHAARFHNILISPGPGRPDNGRDFGICGEVIRAFPQVPTLGVCLGHQGLGLALGARIAAAPELRHGKYSRILHDGSGLYAGMPPGFVAVRYHSLVIEKASCPKDVAIEALAEDDGQIMGIRLEGRPAYGVQFHPESVGTEGGKRLLANFRDLTLKRLRAGSLDVGQIPETISLSSDNPPVPGGPVSIRPGGSGVSRIRELPWKDPEAVFTKVFRQLPAAFWLDSQAAELSGQPAISYMGSGSRLIEAKGTSIRVLEAEPTGKETAVRETGDGDIFSFLGDYLSSRSAFKPEKPETLVGSEKILQAGLLRGGLVGYFGYELKRFAAPGNRFSNPPKETPDALFLEPDRVLAFDHASRKVYATLFSNKEDAASRSWLDELESLWPSLAEKGEPGVRRKRAPSGGFSELRLPWGLSAAKDEYLARIRALQAAIRSGESYEICLTNEIRVSSDAEPFSVYRLLRRINPAPYAAYFSFPQVQVLSASPERFLKLEASGRLSSRPIKGTRRRGEGEAEDAALRADLQHHAKDHSENLMIVDLTRNDFGKVCLPGSVRVSDFMRVEAHPTVLQLVSEVEGRLASGVRPVEAVRACFPGGSMTGAPKLRAMELLEAVEGRARGVFSGVLGYLGCDGTFDLGMAIRSLVRAEGEYRVGCGGAVLDESDPPAEFEEALLKSLAPARALELAVFGACDGWETVNP